MYYVGVWDFRDAAWSGACDVAMVYSRPRTAMFISLFIGLIKVHRMDISRRRGKGNPRICSELHPLWWDLLW
jgi:hypothetical protein